MENNTGQDVIHQGFIDVNIGATYTFFTKLAPLLKIQRQIQGLTYTFFIKIVSLLKYPIDFKIITNDILAGCNFSEKMYRFAPFARQYFLTGDGFLIKMYRSAVASLKMYRSTIASLKMYRSEHAMLCFAQLCSAVVHK